jgi:hypothetical protein
MVEKKAEGITPVVCPAEMRVKEGPKVEDTKVRGQEENRAKRKQKVDKTSQPSSAPTSRWPNAIILGALILILLMIAARRILGRNYRIGRAFEEYVISLFPETVWEIEDRSSDTSKRIGRRITGDVSYDCIMKHRRTSKRFVVQCKYRSRFFRQDDQEGIEWAEPYQIRNYRNFQREKGWPYVGIIGVGGGPMHPKHLFVLPFEHLHDTFIRKAGLEIAGRDPHRPFTVDDQGMLA